MASNVSEIADVLDAAGFDIIIFETVGVGQIEIDVVEQVDSVVLTLVPESGDDIQMLKEADFGVFFEAPKHIRDEVPDIGSVESHQELKEALIKRSNFVQIERKIKEKCNSAGMKFR